MCLSVVSGIVTVIICKFVGFGVLVFCLVVFFSFFVGVFLLLKKRHARDTNLFLTPVTSQVYVKIYLSKLPAGDDVTIIGAGGPVQGEQDRKA